MTPGALAGYRIVDLSQNVAGPYCTRLMAMFGADVIKIEPPGEGDPSRHVGPFKDNVPHPETSVLFLYLNTGKKSLTLNLESWEGARILQELAKGADVLVEGFEPGYLPSLGLGYEALRQVKPDIIMCALPAFGKSGPWADYVCYGVCLEPLAGMFSLTGYEDIDEPQRSGVDHLDPVTGTHAASAIMSALLYRQRTGEGQFIEMPHLESAIMVIGENVLEYTLTGNIPGAMGNRSRRMAPHGVYRCRGDDRWVAIAVATDDEWTRLCRLMGAPELATDPRFSTTAARLRVQDDLDAHITKWTVQQDRYDVMHLLQKHGIAAAAVQDMADLDTDPHLKARDFFQEYDDTGLGVHKHFTAPWRMSGTPYHIRKPANWYFAADTDEVFSQLLGLSPERLSRLQEMGVVVTTPKSMTT